MPLFQQSVVNKYLNDVNKTDLQIAWQAFTAHFHNRAMQENIRNLKEEEYQEGFVRDLFVTVLGFTLNPQPGFNFVLEKKSVTDASKSDGAILLNNHVIAVIELKDTGTVDLEKVSNQAFGYKHKHKNCTYVITANFEKLRFYINDATEFEEFNLFTLSLQRFALMYLCLQQKNLLDNIPLQIKQQSVAKEEHVTKQLYADYSVFKRKLFQNIVAQNPQHDKLLLFKKTQKLLDRFLFIFFSEDRLLLPPNSVREILQQWEDLKTKYDEYFPLYDRFKKYFGYLNIGHAGKQHEIFAYNGGLFLPDEILDNILIDDSILYDGAKALSNYDFETDVDVNILGHIFEHSLAEIEELQATLEGTITEKKITKRKKDGVFYTPRYITKYIVENTVGALCTQQKEKLQINEETFAPQKRKDRRRQLLDTIETYRAWLLQLTICDPACGSGAFLNAALEYLKEEHRTIDELKATLFGDAIVYTDIDNSILENNLFGVDINEEATEIAKLSLWLHTAKKGRKLSNLSNNIKCGNSLIDDAGVAGDKAFLWKEEFKTVFEKGGFDVVIGNPPYGIILSENEQEYLNEKFPLAKYKTNLYVLFLERMFQVFKDTEICFIIPKSLLFNSYYTDLRKHLIINSEIFELFSITEKVFEDAEVGGSLIIRFKVRFSNENLENKIKLISANSFHNFPDDCIIGYSPQKYFLIVPNAEISIVSSDASNIKTKILSFKTLHTFYALKNGLNPGNIKHILISKSKKSEKYKPIVWGKDINRYVITWSGEFVNYDEKIGEQISILDIKSKGGMKAQIKIDFALRNKELFDCSKLLVRKTGDKLVSAFDESNNYYFDTLVHGIYSKDPDYSLKFLLSILNSKAATNLYQILHDIKGKVFAKISLDNLSSFPLPSTNKNVQMEFILKADIMLSKNKELQKLSQQFTQLLQAKISAININRKLENWYSLTCNEFLKEISKQKIKLPLAEQQEWLLYFEDQKVRANSIRNVITETDAAIDKMVYALYGLSEEEVKIVENKS